MATGRGHGVCGCVTIGEVGDWDDEVKGRDDKDGKEDSFDAMKDEVEFPDAISPSILNPPTKSNWPKEIIIIIRIIRHGIHLKANTHCALVKQTKNLKKEIT